MHTPMPDTTYAAAQQAEAGRRGPDVRSDCWVRITPADSGGIDLRLKTKVESMYGESIRILVREELNALGLPNARVELEDAGALPFVLMARIEAAVRRLHGDRGTTVSAVNEYLPEFEPHAQYPTERDRFRRSRLYLPGNEPRFMLNAGLHGPDGVILDLEDSVAPAVKDEARLLVRNALRTVDFKGAERMVRINQGERGLEDLDFVVPHNLHVVLIPKVEDPEQVRRVDAHIGEILRRRAADFSPRGAESERTARLSPGGAAQAPASGSSAPARTIYLMPIVESARGAIKAYEIATASPNICALTIGLEDYTADIGTQRTDEGRESFWARCQVVNAARAAGVQPIDSVFSDVSDMDALRASVLEAKGLGFDGKGCIHPRQIRVIHEAFAPSAAELEKAQKIVAAFEEAQAKGLGAVALGSKMIDPPVVKRAQRVVNLAKAIAMI
jgi:citrate lyase subunit beta/citryl-CoA lyase